MAGSSRGLFGFVARLRPSLSADSDADLLERFVRTADQTAFTGLVQRHGAMVLSVCRRRLGAEADAEDAFQAVFLALATSAATIRQRESLSGWLYRVAHQIALKAAGRRARRPVAALPTSEVPMPESQLPVWEADELKTVIDAEVAGLPDKLRAVIVLCLIEGRTNTEAAAALAVPTGTVDSRLSAARKTLQARLTRRGVAVGAGIALEQLLGGPVEAAGPRLTELFTSTISAVLTEAAGPGGGAVSPAVIELARGVTVMTTNLRVFATLGLVLGLLGSAGAGFYLTAADPVAPPAKAADRPLTPELVTAPPAAKPAVPEAKADVNATGEAALLKLVGAGLAPEGATVEEVLAKIEQQTGLIVRVDIAAFRRIGVISPAGGADGNAFPTNALKTIYDTKIVLPSRAEKLSLRDALVDALAQVRLEHPCTYQIRGTQLVIVPAYVPAVRPGVNPLDHTDDDVETINLQMSSEQIYGGVVSVSAEHKPLADILADLRKQTGANIVLDPRCETQDKKPGLTVTLNDVRLYDAVRVLADMAELKMVYAGNIYYVTTAANAKTFQPPVPRQPILQTPPFNPQPNPGGVGGGPGR
ncbi:RNA polymerase sigma factor [Gemmata sp. G18]|uniref:RNA polymerase sigma factor n=1 Tax=Gemmata palustris TaxID=2822762 RepID=A0ABS5BP98_9BACT|nr:RNA polymerase sigma factor [Gemmata palustris]MBP3955130.1 RNA polymerase sigma factor [Gemmata palustris]